MIESGAGFALRNRPRLLTIRLLLFLNFFSQFFEGYVVELRKPTAYVAVLMTSFNRVPRKKYDEALAIG